jgi:hypothetical protein
MKNVVLWDVTPVGSCRNKKQEQGTRIGSSQLKTLAAINTLASVASYF